MFGAVETVIGCVPGVVGRGNGTGGGGCTALTMIGGLGPGAVKAGNKSAAVGAVPDPVANCGCG
jgi:hypothetical protein